MAPHCSHSQTAAAVRSRGSRGKSAAPAAPQLHSTALARVPSSVGSVHRTHWQAKCLPLIKPIRRMVVGLKVRA